MPTYSVQATTHPSSLATWNIAHAYSTTVALSGGVTLVAQNELFGYADMLCRLYFPGNTTGTLPSITVDETVYHYDGSAYVYDHVNTNARTGVYNSTYDVTAYPLSGNESMLTGSYDGTTNYTDATLFSSSTSTDDMAHIARDYFDLPTTAYCNWGVYTLGHGHNTLYTLICKDLVPQSPYTENDYEIYVGVTSNVAYDGANVGTFAYTSQHFDISYDDLFYAMFEQEQADATTQGYFILTAALRHYDNEDVVVDDRYKFHIDTATGYITSEETQTAGTIEFNYDTPAEEDDTFDVTADDLPGQAPGQNLSVDNLLTTSYVLTDTSLQAFGRYIWNNDLTTQMYAYQTSPIENILSCRRIPFAETGTATNEIKLGNVSIPIPANICESLHRFQVGTVHNLPTNIFTDSNGKNHPWLAFSDFVQVSIYLPYVGIQKIPNTYCWGKTPNSATPSIYARDITIEYIYDVVFGTCAACLYCDGTMFAAYNGSCAIDIPITASNRAQIEHSLIKTGVNGAAASVNKVVEGATNFNPVGMITGAISTAFNTYSQMKADQITADLHFQTSGGFSSQVASLMSGDVYIFIQYPDYKEESTYKHEYGYPCNLSLNLSNLHGYTEIDHGVDLSSIPCFDDEKVFLEQALTSGFYL